MTSRIVIAGGGIGGLTTAVALARAGHDVVVLERSARLHGVGAGLMLAPNGMAALAEIDPALAARVRADGHVTAPDEVRLIMDAAGRVLSREPVGATAAAHGHPLVPILRQALHQALSDAVLAAGAQVRSGADVIAIANAPGGATAVLADGSVEHGELVVAADGLRSVARAAFVADGPPRYSGYTSVRGHCPGPGGEGFVVNGRGVQLFVAPVGDGHYWAAKITAAEGDWPRRALPDVRAALLAHRWPRPAADLLARTATDDLVVTDVHDRDPLRRWVYGRVALLGDAAHPMVPALGQGANMAIEDAAALAACLAELPDTDAALAAYESRRCERAADVVLASRSQGESDQGAGRLRALARDLAVRLRGRKDADVPALTTIGG